MAGCGLKSSIGVSVFGTIMLALAVAGVLGDGLGRGMTIAILTVPTALAYGLTVGTYRSWREERRTVGHPSE